MGVRQGREERWKWVCRRRHRRWLLYSVGLAVPGLEVLKTRVGEGFEVWPSALEDGRAEDPQT